jgi:hypothetical protein
VCQSYSVPEGKDFLRRLDAKGKCGNCILGNKQYEKVYHAYSGKVSLHTLGHRREL